MGDNLSKEKRSKIMKSIRSVSKLENRFSTALWHKGIRFRKNDKSLYGKPDISIKKYKIVIFIDSCFWHRCPIHGNLPKSNAEFWKNKLKRTIERDQEVNEHYMFEGWTIIRIWEHELKDDFEGVVSNVSRFIKNQYH